LIESDQLRVWSDGSANRWILGFVGERAAVAAAARIAVDALKAGRSDLELDEPPLNLVAIASGPGRVALMLFPRAAHRPACYFASGPDRRVVSPGAIDVAGVVVTVRHEDYLELRSEDVAQILAEVSRPADPAWIKSVLLRRLADG
jgi:hypothetical protein